MVKRVLVDSNIWLALTLSGHEFHDSALDWLETVTDQTRILLCRSTQQSLLRLLTTSAVLGTFGSPALTNTEAWTVFRELLADSRIEYASEPAHLERHWETLAVRPTASPKLWMDAYLAAFALAGNYRLVTTDSAFKQFNGLDLLLLQRS